MEATRLPNWFSVKPVYMSDEKPRVSTFVRVTPLDIFQDMSGQFSVVVVVTKLGIFVRRFHWCLWWPFYARPCCFPNPYLVFPCFQTQPEHEHSVVAGEKFKIEPKETLSSNLSVVLCLYLFMRLGFGRVKARKLLSLKKIRLNRVLFPTRQTLVGVIINFLTNWTFIKQIRH